MKRRGFLKMLTGALAAPLAASAEVHRPKDDGLFDFCMTTGCQNRTLPVADSAWLKSLPAGHEGDRVAEEMRKVETGRRRYLYCDSCRLKLEAERKAAYPLREVRVSLNSKQRLDALLNEITRKGFVFTDRGTTQRFIGGQLLPFWTFHIESRDKVDGKSLEGLGVLPIYELEKATDPDALRYSEVSMVFRQMERQWERKIQEAIRPPVNTSGQPLTFEQMVRKMEEPDVKKIVELIAEENDLIQSTRLKELKRRWWQRKLGSQVTTVRQVPMGHWMGMSEQTARPRR